MMDLEDRGLLTHLHTSGGRLPTNLGFRAYVEAVPAHAKALYSMDALRDLFRSLGKLGLTPAELRASKRVVLKAVAVPGLTSDQLEAAIMATHMGVAMR